METLKRIAELTDLVNNASTPTVDGRQTVANSCKELYNLIENDVIEAEKEFMLKGMYNDLCNGNFAEPFMCEQNKTTFNAIVVIYNKYIIPYL
jgi:hypothetical protein